MAKKEQDEFDLLIEQIRKDYGDGSVMYGMSESHRTVPCDIISTRCLALDIALGVGGVPRGRVVEIFGPESSGKTTLALEIVAEAQSQGLMAVYVDVEHACDRRFMTAIGVDLNKLVFSQPDTAEEALGIIEKLVDSGKVAVVVLDSVAALVTKDELEGEIDQVVMGAQARIMSKVLRKLKGKIAKTNTCVIFINQMREKIGRFMPGSSNEVTPGGKALKFYASVRLDVRRIGSMQTGTADQKQKVGNETKVKVVKNKVASPFREAIFGIVFGKGISKAGSILDSGVQYHIINRTSTIFKYGDKLLGNNKQSAIDFIESDKELSKELRQKIFNAAIAKPTEENAGV
jgi:recombination protein RecA